MQDIYNDRTYLANNPTWHEEDAPFKAERILRLLRRHPVPRATVCEVGCGSGEVLVQLAAQLPGSTFTGFDISEDALALAAPKQTARLRFEQHDLAAQPVTEPYDLLLVIDVIEHLPNYFQFLEGIASASRYTVFHIPLDLSLWSLLREQMLIESKARVGHIHNFTEDFILSVLADYGFRVMDKMYTEPRYKHWSLKERLTHALRRALYSISPRLCSKILGGYSLMVLTENPAR
ncbi:class I SAM-dependent methyltransferase [Hymenobacter monticola]|uniref:Methyltransferase domain-containing protein n=1 Tax=Hymenobacter monticola TaxID=1705399 RepID=A0ABY4B7C2_9BACT|nr:class I SAM-dependent methyltransferase [Hymenobacter monticola]UOE32590.1 methyltransferase domain-containing protein [Hymenobacter monticola]